MTNLFLRIGEFFRPRADDMPQVHKQLLDIILVVSGAALFILTPITLWEWVATGLPNAGLFLLSDVLTFALVALIWHWNQTGHTRRASSVLTIGFSLILLGTIPFTPGDNAVVSVALLIVIGAFVYAPATALAIAGVASLVYLLTVPATGTVFFIPLVWVVIATIGWTTATYLQGALERLQHMRAQLEQNNQALEERVQQRTAELQASNESLKQEILERQRAEQELALKAELLDATLDLVLLADANGRILYANQAAYNFDTSPNTLMQGGLDAIHSDKVLLREQLAFVIAQGKHAFPVTFTGANGIRHTEVNARTLVRENETLVLATVRDVTARIKSEQELRESEQRLQATLDALAAEICVLDEDGTIVTVNQVWRNMASQNGGTPENTGPGTNYLAVCRAAATAGDEIAAQVAQAIQDILQGVRSDFMLEYPCHSPTTQHWYTLQITSFGNTHSPRLVVSHEEITARVLAEQRTLEAGKLYRDFFEKTTATLLLIDPETGNIIDANPSAAEYYGYTHTELLGLKVTSINILPPTETHAEMALARAEKRNYFNFRHRLKSGDIRDVEVYSTPIEYQERTLLYSIVHDITERRRAEAQIQVQHELSLALANATTPDEIFDTLMEAAARVDNLDAGGLYQTDPQTGNIHLVKHRGIQPEILPFIEFMPADTPQAKVAHQAIPSYLFRSDGTLPPTAFNAQEGLRAVCVLPIVHEGKNIGLINLASHTHDSISPDARRILEAFASQIGSTLARLYTEQALQRSEAKFRSLFVSNPEPTFVVDRETLRFLEVNDMTVAKYGYTREEFLQRDVHAIRPDTKLPELLHTWNDPTKPFEFTGPSTHYLKDGTEIQVIITVNSLDYEGRPALIILAHDVTHERAIEKQIRISEERYRGLIESQRDLVVRVNADGRFTFVNEAYCNTFGKTRAELLDGTYMPLVHPDDLAATQQAMKGLNTPPYRIQVEQRAWTVRGWRWFEWEDYALRDEKGITVEIQAVGRDVTERKQMIAALAESEDFYRTLVDALPLALLRKDAEGRITFGNAKYLEEVGRPFGKIEGKTDFDLHPPELAEQYRRDDLHVITTGETFTTIETHQVLGGKRSFAEVIKTPLRAADGTVTGIQIMYWDVTEREEMQRTLRANEERHRAILDAIPDMMFITDEQGNYLDFHAPQDQDLYVPPDVFLNRNMHDLLPPTLTAQFDLHYARARSGEHAEVLEYELPSGNTREYFEARIVNFSNDKFLTIVRNITERKQAETVLRMRTQELALANASLAQANRHKDEFLASMSHELRTPLNTILGMSEVLNEGIHGPLNDKQREATHFVIDSGRHLLALINDILDLSKIQAGKMKITPEPVRLDDLGNAALRFVQQTAHKKHQDLSYHISDTALYTRGDPRLLKQVLINLLNNAVKFTPPHGKIALEIQAPDDDTIVLTVSDTGIGIAPQDHQKLFQPFVQLDSRLNRQYEGTGLGLVLVARIVELHQGSVTVTSTPGQGSRFSVTLPRTYMDAVPQTQRATTNATITQMQEYLQAHPTKVLITDDNPETLDFLESRLQKLGFRVLTAPDGQSAIDNAFQSEPALILMDIQMPGMDGLETMKHLRKNTRLAQVPIFAITALAMPGDRERCLEAGADEYLTKPIDFAQLVHLAWKYLNPHAHQSKDNRNANTQ